MLTEKEKNIAYFKHGFGDQTFPVKHWIWFEDNDEEIRYLEDLLEKYKQYLSSG